MNSKDKGTSDREYTDFLIKHITNPCASSHILMSVYVNEAKRELPYFKDASAKKDLEKCVTIADRILSLIS